MVEVPQRVGESGDTICAAQGMTCVDAPVLNPPEAACIAFHPTASVTATGNGWEQGIYCENNPGGACVGKTNNCHNCPPCTAGLNCQVTASDFIERIYVSCVP